MFRQKELSKVTGLSFSFADSSLQIKYFALTAGQNIDVYSRPVMPTFGDKTSVAVAFLNKWTQGTPLKVSFKLTDLGLDHATGYRASDVFTGQDLGLFKPDDTFNDSVNPTGILVVKFSIISSNKHKYFDATVSSSSKVN